MAVSWFLVSLWSSGLCGLWLNKGSPPELELDFWWLAWSLVEHEVSLSVFGAGTRWQGGTGRWGIRWGVHSESGKVYSQTVNLLGRFVARMASGWTGVSVWVGGWDTRHKLACFLCAYHFNYNHFLAQRKLTSAFLLFLLLLLFVCFCFLHFNSVIYNG